MEGLMVGAVHEDDGRGRCKSHFGEGGGEIICVDRIVFMQPL